jgi:predicted phosphate transport protein (TIGR00153 family)
MDILFHRTRRLERQIDEYLDLVVQGGLIYRAAVDHYMEDRHDDFGDRLNDLQNLESKADELRREIETRLYTETLLPESRGDILGLLETIDKVINRCEESLQDFSVEKPDILPELLTEFRELIASTVDCVDEMVMAARSYFRDPKAVRDHIARARFHEQASDRVGGKIRRQLFAADIDLASKLHQRDFSVRIDRIADGAEDVCDRLAIANIKRSL